MKKEKQIEDLIEEVVLLPAEDEEVEVEGGAGDDE